MAAAQYLHVPGYSALILRRRFPDLKRADGLIPRSLEWWKNTDARWNAQDKKWTFPCPGGGESVIQFGFCDHENDIYQYQGSQFQYVGWDELTQFTEQQYRYLFSRQSRPATGPLHDVPLRVRGASNPGGVGHGWVKARFVEAKSRPVGTYFIPSFVSDNPTVDHDEYVRSLSYLDPTTRDQLLKGDWDAMDDGRFKRAWLRYYQRYGNGYVLAGTVYTAESVVARFLTVDPAATVKETAKADPDYTVVSAWGYTRDGMLLWLGCDRFRAEVPEIAPRMHKSYKFHRSGKAYIEGGGMQKAVYQVARRHQPPMNIIPVNPASVGDKLVRATPFLNMAEAGRVWLPAAGASDGPFPLDDVVSELLRFTGDSKQSGHDDIFDTGAWAGDVVERGLVGSTGIPWQAGGA